ncbi:CHAP domain-containing protein [Gordonia polyisoprenivorans]|uniref:CHAP domain-containing protein n=1 Tax=Gordonia polyisoprenivorans TaxID=84595 RepID=UPI0022349547|nr:CHAP domain-containing protein [Gordonia polyisoprenivorans]
MRRTRAAWVIALVVIAACTATVIGVRAYRHDDDAVSRAVNGMTGRARPPFPVVDTTTMTASGARIIESVRAEYARNASGTTYSGGVDEPWCADFVSTVMHESGVPLDNPNSGSWRIPGVATLTDYLHSSGRWRGPGHRPQPGDIVIYDKPSPWGQHTNIVVAVNGDEVTTVGGNQPPDGVTLHTADLAADPGPQGFGVPAGT